MRSYILAMAVAMLLSAVYAFQNTTEITVNFLMLQRAFPQGVWEVILFSIGAVLMWFFSIIASLEIHSKNGKQLKERDKRISDLEEEKNALLAAFKHIAPSTDPFAKPEEDDGAKDAAADTLLPVTAEGEPDDLRLGEAERPAGETGEIDGESSVAPEDEDHDEEKESSFV